MTDYKRIILAKAEIVTELRTKPLYGTFEEYLKAEYRYRVHYLERVSTDEEFAKEMRAKYDEYQQSSEVYNYFIESIAQFLDKFSIMSADM